MLFRCLGIKGAVSKDVRGCRNDVCSASPVAMTTLRRAVCAEDIAGSAPWRLYDSANIPTAELYIQRTEYDHRTVCVVLNIDAVVIHACKLPITLVVQVEQSIVRLCVCLSVWVSRRYNLLLN